MNNRSQGPACPRPHDEQERITLAHGGGGRLTQRLIGRIAGILAQYQPPLVLNDSAVLEGTQARLAFTTDGYVVSPIFFPGGDIGTLAVCGTANDLAMAGAEPRWLSLALILEEGFLLADLERVIHSIGSRASEGGLAVVCGDTKVVERGKGDQIFVTTSGIGLIAVDPAPLPARVRPGDRVLISSDIGRHGVTLLSLRDGLSFSASIESDCRLLWPSVRGLFDAHIVPHALRDCTRGGLAAAVNEIAQAATVSVELMESEIPVGPGVQGASELLGLDPLHIANEGCFVCFVDAEKAKDALAVLRTFHPQAACIGSVCGADRPRVTLKNCYGISRIVEVPTGEQLPRIC